MCEKADLDDDLIIISTILLVGISGLYILNMVEQLSFWIESCLKVYFSSWLFLGSLLLIDLYLSSLTNRWIDRGYDVSHDGLLRF